MENNTTRFVVTGHPPWHAQPPSDPPFTCERTHGLLHTVASLMMRSQRGLSDTEKSYKPQNVYKTIRSAVIRDAETIRQKPSCSLLCALMDLVDIEGGNGLESVVKVDKAGLKHTLLAHSNYKAFHIPSKELIGTVKGKKVIPVLTQYSDEHNFSYYDKGRSSIGTYAVGIPTPGTGDKVESYFLQEVLYTPGLESLKVLQSVAGDKFEFWDMCLEVPTHISALTPSFQQIQPCQLLRTEANPPSTSASNSDTPVADVEEIQPMCCVLGQASVGALKKKRAGSVDCIPENQVRCNLKHFQCDNDGIRAVYFRRSGKVIDGKKVNLVSFVALRNSQAQARVLYVSTTLRFCRAVKQSCVKGKGEPAGCWNETLREFERKTFVTGTSMYQEIHNSALTAFTNRVNPNSWCNRIPKHVESRIGDPVMVEVVDLAIRFMDNKIPNAFAVAELLHCPIEKVRDHLTLWNMYLTNSAVHSAMRKKRLGMVTDQMKVDWAALTEVACSYSRKGHENENAEMVSACERLFREKPLDNVVKVQKTWHALVKQDTRQKNDKELVQMHANIKVLFLKLRTYHNKVKGEPTAGDRAGRGEGERDGSQSESSSPRSAKARNRGSERPAEVRERNTDEATAGDGERDESLFSNVAPESIPISTWIKNLSTVLLCEPWLTGDALRREAVCTLLGLSDTLLGKEYGDILGEWAIANRSVIRILKTHGLRDTLSKALVDCLESMSSDTWRERISLSFYGTRDCPREHSDQLAPGRRDEMLRGHEGDECKRLSRGVGNPTKKPAPSSHPETAERPRPACEAHGSSVPKSARSTRDRKTLDLRGRSERRREEERPWLSEAEEGTGEEEESDEDDYEIPGDDLEATMSYDDSEPLDEYDHGDGFIDDGPVEVEYSSEEDGDDGEDDQVDAFDSQAKSGPEKAKFGSVNRAHRYGRIYRSDAASADAETADEDSDHHHHRTPEPNCSGVKDTVALKRVLQSDSEDDEYVGPRVKRAKRTTATRRRPAKGEDKRSAIAKVAVRHSDRERGTPTKEKSPLYSRVLGSDTEDDVFIKPDVSFGSLAKHTKKNRRPIDESEAESRDEGSEASDSFSEPDDHEGEGRTEERVEGLALSKIKSTRSERRQARRATPRDERRLCDDLRRGPDIAPKREKAKIRGRRSPDVSLSPGRTLRGEAAVKPATVTDRTAQTTRPSDPNFRGGGRRWDSGDERDSAEERDGKEERLDGEPTSPAECSSADHSDIESGPDGRLDDSRLDGTEPVDPDPDSGEEYLVSM